MEGEKSPEYFAIKSNQTFLEKQLAAHLKGIAGKLRDRDFLTNDRYYVIIESGRDGPGMLIGDILDAISVDPVVSFFNVVEAMKTSGNAPFIKYVETTIEGTRKDKYRELLKKSGTSGSSYDVFISYGQEDHTKAIVDQIAKPLREKGFKVFVDRSSLKPGDLWSAEMVSGIQSCKAFVAVLTNKYVRSKFCHGELYEAEDQGKPFFPVVVERDWDTRNVYAAIPVKGILQSTQYSRFDTKENIDKNLPDFVSIIEAKL